ncbi:FG-GAP-like repeat-containing protein [Phnomibacter sp.]|uniref:FG-GAP repeat domain-containing protein n=1 Tax=Phnomibacter sp. TaxID=2836217 RepID=UPI003FA7B7C0
MFSGSYDGTIYYFPNLGKTPYSIPKFPGTPIDVDPLPGYTNPFEAIGIPQYSRVSFADIDADGDFDAFIGHNYNYGGLKYFKNTGTAASPMFEEQTGSAALPISLGSLTNPARQAMAAFGDLNRDGRLDVLFGLSNGQIKYFTNVGTACSPRFSEMTGTKNPLSGYSFIQMQALAPSLVDIDKDGDLDLFVGVYGGIRYFENTAAPLPVVWKDFSVQQQGSGVLLKWATQQEQQTKDFVAQHSTDGINWTTICTVKAAGNSALAKEYQYLHATAAAGINYYRLLQRDIDDQSAVSAVRNIRLQGALAGFTASVQGNQLLLQVREPMELSLLNAQGAVLRKSRFATGYQQLDMSQYPAGVYFVLGNGQTSRIVRQ